MLAAPTNSCARICKNRADARVASDAVKEPRITDPSEIYPKPSLWMCQDLDAETRYTMGWIYLRYREPLWCGISCTCLRTPVRDHNCLARVPVPRLPMPVHRACPFSSDPWTDAG